MKVKVYKNAASTGKLFFKKKKIWTLSKLYREFQDRKTNKKKEDRKILTTTMNDLGTSWNS